MKNKLVALLIVLLIAGNVFAQSVITEQGTTTIDGKKWNQYSSQSGIIVLVYTPVPEDLETRITSVINMFDSWTNIKIKEVHAIFSGNTESYIAIPSSVTYDGKEYIENIPSGIRFTKQEETNYNFRIMTGEYFVRLEGVLVNDKILASEISQATEKPLVYISERDPQWAVKQIYTLQSGIEVLRYSLAAKNNFFGKAVSKEVVQYVLSQREANPEVTQKEILASAKENGLKTSAREINAICNAWFGE